MRRSIIGVSTFREIKQSFGRFLAIFAIAALGVGLFAGLKVTRTAMVESVEAYFDSAQFYDYKLVSTLGYTEEDAAFFAAQDGVRAAEGALSFDILCADEEGNENVLIAHSLTETVNQVQLVAGRMPKSGDECLADSEYFSESDIGTTIYLAQDNEDEDLEHFVYRAYTITGLVKSPLYIQFERGNSSLGTGRVSGFLYLLPEGFDADYYTEIYVKLDRDYPLYDDAYDAYIDGLEETWEALSEARAELRYETIVAEAEEELSDAEQAFEEEKAKAQQELSDALAKLSDAEQAIADAKEQIAEAEEELSDAEQTIAEKEQELSDGKAALLEQEEELSAAKEELSAQEAALLAGREALAAAGEQLTEAESELAAQSAELEEQEAALLAAESELSDAEAEISLQLALLAKQSAELDIFEAAYPQGTMPEEAAVQLAAGRAQIAEAQEELLAAQTELAASRAELTTGQETVAAGKEQLTAAQTELAANRAEFAAQEEALAEAEAELLAAKAQIAAGEDALADVKEQIADAESELLVAKQELSDGKETLSESRAALLDAEQEYEDGLSEYEDGLAEFNEQVADGEAELADARARIAELSEPEIYVLGRDANVGYVCFESDSTIVDGIANVFPVFFFLVAALVCMTTMNRMVEEQRTQIGVLKALGYGESTIMSKYLVYSGTAAIAGCCLGFFGGTWMFPKVIWECYRIMYTLDSVRYVFAWKLALISLVVSALCSMGVTWASCRRELYTTAAQLMRPKAPKPGKRVFLERVPLIWERLSFLRKVSLRNIFRYKKRLFMMIIGISGCTALLITGFGVRESIVYIADRQFEEIQIYDLGVTFSEAVGEELEADIKETVGDRCEETLCVMETSFNVVADGGIKSVNLVAIDPEADCSDFLLLHDADGEPIAWPGEGEAVFTSKLADTLGIGVGDVVQLRNDDMETITVQASGISENFIYNYVYIGTDTYEEQMGREAECKTLYVNAADGADVHLVSAAFMKLEQVRSVTVNEDTRTRISSMMQSMNLLVAVIILCAAGLAAIVLYNLTNINITERVREIATIKVLGFYKTETAAYVFRENMLLTILGTVPGLLLGHYLHRFVMSRIQIDMVAFDVKVGVWGYLFSVILTLVFAFIVNSFMRIKLERISMTESLKSVD